MGQHQGLQGFLGQRVPCCSLPGGSPKAADFFEELRMQQLAKVFDDKAAACFANRPESFLSFFPCSSFLPVEFCRLFWRLCLLDDVQVEPRTNCRVFGSKRSLASCRFFKTSPPNPAVEGARL